ncbi:hypothetical protein EVAR_77629_1 [Eumeta japonica]|uniref:Uncharacterized protein n=1 Tax=Eumeta variegata TaxID=151549 RepID=A0A4C1T9Y6_EUMVA|nr:hypothetical protein EVAR_77629_1 [Eumeta japonica]
MPTRERGDKVLNDARAGGRRSAQLIGRRTQIKGDVIKLGPHHKRRRTSAIRRHAARVADYGKFRQSRTPTNSMNDPETTSWASLGDFRVKLENVLAEI